MQQNILENGNNALVKSSDQSYNELTYVDTVREVLDAHFLDSLRPPLEKDVMDKTVGRWAEVFNEARIPASKLMQVYNRAFKSKSAKEYFDLSNILRAWDEMQLESAQTTNIHNVKCGICSGTKKVKVMNFETGKDEEKDCNCVAFTDNGVQ